MNKDIWLKTTNSREATAESSELFSREQTQSQYYFPIHNLHNPSIHQLQI